MSKKRRPRINTTEENDWFENQKTKFAWLTEQAQVISNRIGKQIANPRQGYGTWLWLRACVTSASMIRLFEPHIAGNARYIDHASLAALARAHIENVSACIYLSDQSVSDEEWDARKLIMRLNDLVNRRTFLRQLGQPVEDDWNDIEAQFRDQLESNPVFKAVPPDKRGKLLNGSNMLLHGRHNTMLVFGWGDEMTAGVYKYLSSHAHTTAMAFLRTELNEVYEPHSNASKVTAGFAIEHARQTLGTGCLHMIELFPYVEAAFGELVFVALKQDYRPPVKSYGPPANALN
jgi:hypothetical protein